MSETDESLEGRMPKAGFPLPWTERLDWYCDKISYAACPKTGGGCIYNGKVCKYLMLHTALVAANGKEKRYPPPGD